MPFLLEHIVEVVLSILAAVVLGNVLLVILAVARRQRREKYFQRIDALRQQFGPMIAGTLADKADYPRTLQALRGITGRDREYLLEQLCLEKPVTTSQIPVLRSLCEDLGLVKLWQRQLAGELGVGTLRDALARPEGIVQRIGRLSFLRRAKCAENLGTIRHQPSWPLLLKALRDPHADVQSTALRALAAIRAPESLPALVEGLHEVVLKPRTRLSLRSVKTALVRFPLEQALSLLPSLGHSHPRIRFLAVDIIREMVERIAVDTEDFALTAKNFPSELAEVFLTRLCFDEKPDVRARTAPVLAYLEDPRAVPVLLTLLGDPVWYVRLHTVRALAKDKYQSQVSEIVLRLTDKNWMVRESAGQTLSEFGKLGINILFEHFLSTQDRYSREQIADLMQRAGLIPALLDDYGSSIGGKESRVMENLARMGKTSYLLAVLTDSPDRKLRKMFLTEFGTNSDPQIQAWVRDRATRDPDAEVRALAQTTMAAATS